MDDREKIAEILCKAFENCCGSINCNKCIYTYEGEMCRELMYADALMAAGIDDVAELTHRAEVAERALKLLGEEYYNEFELDECEYTPEKIAEFIKRYIVRAEKELEEGR